VRHKHVIGLVVLALAGMAAPAASAADIGALKCVSALEGGDMGERFCFNEADCLVAHYHTTFLGTERTCLVPRPAGATTTDPTATRCVQHSAGEFGTRYCVSTEDSCIVSQYRWGGVEGEYSCLVSRPQ
jgi:hypothetical protein